MMTARSALTTCAMLMVVPPVAFATTIHVPGGQPTIQAGIDAASAGDTVLVACGTYFEHDIAMKSGVCLASATGLPDCVTIDAQQLGRVLYFNEVDGQASAIGLTVTGGLADDPFPGGWGGGVACRYSSPTFARCVFKDNAAESGAGMYCWNYSEPVVSECVFVGNVASSSGGGMDCYLSSPAIMNCLFYWNEAGQYGGGGLYCGTNYDADWVIAGCTFFDNNVSADGGAVYCWMSAPTFENCIMAFSDAGQGIACGVDALPTLTCCDVYGNAGGDALCGEDGGGNFSQDPLFCDGQNADLSLNVLSPCAPANNPSCGLVGALGAACDSPAERTSWGTLKALFRQRM